MTLDPAATKPLAEFKHTAPLTACRYDPGGRFLVAAAQDGSVRRYDLQTGRADAFTAHAAWARAVAFAPPGLMAVGDYHGQLTWYLLLGDTPKPVRVTKDAHTGWVRAAAASPDGTALATCGNDRLVRVWSVYDGTLLKTLTGHESHVYHVGFHPAGRHMVSADLKGQVKVWDWHEAKEVRALDGGLLHKYDGSFRADIGGPRGLAFSPDGTQLALAGITNVSNAFAGVGNPLVLLYDWLTGTLAQKLAPKEAFQGTAWGVAYHPAGWVIAGGGGNGGQVWFWTPDQPAAKHAVNLPASGRDLALHPGGRQFAVAGADGVARTYALAVTGV